MSAVRRLLRHQPADPRQSASELITGNAVVVERFVGDRLRTETATSAFRAQEDRHGTSRPGEGQVLAGGPAVKDLERKHVAT